VRFSLIFTLFSNRVFEVDCPEALIEAYCFQSDFFAAYDLKRKRDDSSYDSVGRIGARTKKDVLEKCKKLIKNHQNLGIFSLDLDSFLEKTSEEKDRLTLELHELAEELDDVPGVGFSKATKILHTRFPEIIPMIDNPLQDEYRSLKPQWKKGDWHQLFNDYYDNFLVKETFSNLCKVHSDLSFLNLTKVRVFNILWWSFLKSKNKELKEIKWKTIRQLQ
jgi:hypothetical protein